MYDQAKYVARCEDGKELVRQHGFDSRKRRVTDRLYGTGTVIDSDGEDLGRGHEYRRIARMSSSEFEEEVLILMSGEDDVEDLPSSAEEAEEDGFVQIRSVDTSRVSSWEVPVYARRYF